MITIVANATPWDKGWAIEVVDFGWTQTNKRSKCVIPMIKDYMATGYPEVEYDSITVNYKMESDK